MTVPSAGPPAAVLDTAFFRRWLSRATQEIEREAAYLTELDSAIGDADHGSNLKRGFTSASAAMAAESPGTPGALVKAFGNHLTNTVGGASGPLYGTVLRQLGKTLGAEEPVRPRTLGDALDAAVAGVRRLGDAAPGDKTMVDALAPAAEAYAAVLGSGAGAAEALAAAARAAREGAEATVPMRARRGRASYLGERSIGHQDPGATSTALLITALHEATGPELRVPRSAGNRATAAAGLIPAEAKAEAEAARTPVGTTSADSTVPTAPEAKQRVGIVLVSHSRDVAVATAELAKALVGAGTPSPIAAAGGVEDGGIGTSAALVEAAVKRVDTGLGTVVLCDMGSAVLTVKAMLGGTGSRALPPNVRIADAPFVEGAVAALVTASAGAGIDLVIAAADDARAYRKV